MNTQSAERLGAAVRKLAAVIGLASIALWTEAHFERAKAQDDPFVGQIVLFGSSFCPRGWAEADGQLMPIKDNTALFSLFGTIYGGDGRTTFGLPKFPQPHGLRYCVALVGIYPSRS